jgi:GT2 family glycosyltransferase
VVLVSQGSTVACVILNWNGGPDTLHCLESIYGSAGVSIEVIVVDNGSIDNSPGEIAARFPHAMLIRQNKNTGVAAGFNTGIRQALTNRRDFVFLLNNDAVVEPHTIATLLKEIEMRSSAGMITPRIMDGLRQGRMWFDGGERNLFGDFVHRGMNRRPDPDTATRASAFATGCAMLLRSRVFTEIGGFDESYFAYSEDADFSVRARQNGWEIFHAPQAVVVHYPSSSIKRNAGKWLRDYYVTRNKLRLLHHDLPFVPWSIFLVFFLVTGILAPSLYFCLRGEWRRIRGVVGGVEDFMGGRFGERSVR